MAHRTNQYKTIGAAIIYEGQLIANNPLEGCVFDFSVKKSDNIIGYAAYFKLINGFEKTVFMSVDDVKKHAEKFSQTYKKKAGIWHDEFDSMAQKTVLKNALSKYGVLSVELQMAIASDSSVIEDAENGVFSYVDNEDTHQVQKPKETIDQRASMEHAQRIAEFIFNAKSVEKLAECEEHLDGNETLIKIFNDKKESLKDGNI